MSAKSPITRSPGAWAASARPPNATVPTHILRITGTHHTCATRMVGVLDRAQRNRHVITFDAAEFFRTFAPAVANAPDHSTILSPVGELDRETRVDRTASIHPR
jgi:hypothetical protein